MELSMLDETAPMWSGLERNAWKLPELLTVSEWADRNRVLDPMISAEPGQWITDRTPYLRGIMDAFIDPDVEEITLMMSAQVGKTESELNFIGYCIDQDPGPLLYVSTRADDAESVNVKRVQPMVRLSEALHGHMTSREDDFKKEEITLDRMLIYFCGANSPAALASKPIRYLILDEVDKYPKFSGRESDPIKLARERTNTFWNRKIIKSSTPTTRQGYIFREYEQSDKRKYFVPCPYCGHYQVLNFLSGVKFPEEERDPQKIRDRRLAWYECAKCKEKIDDAQKHRMLLKGVWLQDGQSVDKNGVVAGERVFTRKIGFWINALYSPWKTFSDIAAEFLSCEGRPELLMNFVNSWLAEVWEERTLETTEKKILSLQIEYPPVSIPQNALILTAGVDVQKDHFYYAIRAWGAHEESWLVRALRVETWDELITDIFKTEYAGEDGYKAFVRLACIDSGYRADEVYELCRHWRDRARPTKGVAKLSGVPYMVSKIDRNPKTGEVIQEGLSLFRLDTTYFKDKISRFINSQREDRSHWHIYKGVSDQYVKQMCSEHKVIVRNKTKGQAWEEWQLKGSATPNHFWDCEVAAAAAAEMLRVSTLKPEDVRRIRLAQAGDESRPQKNSNSPGGWNRGNTAGWFQR